MSPLALFPLTALIPLLIGFIYYHPKVMGNTWMKVTGLTPDSMKKGNMAAIFGLTYLFSLMLAFFMPSIVVHQTHVLSVLLSKGGYTAEDTVYMEEFFRLYGTRYRWFGHGALHGTITAVFFALPILGINALFERRGGKYIFIHLGYWVITLLLMGGTVCHFYEFSFK